jgi:UDP-N-acetyl-2-amino-2-deoxyglucuronate dehydrogenase
LNNNQTTIAIIGCGRNQGGKEGFGIAYQHATAWRNADPSCRILAVDINKDNLETFASTYSLPKENLFTSAADLYQTIIPDVVSVCTWPGLHAPMVTEAANAGVKTILCEKPMALNMLEVNRMLAVCKEKRTQLAVTHQRRFNPYFMAVKDFLKTEMLGGPFVLEFRVSDGWDILSWTTHWFDQANFLLDRTPDWVMAGIDFSGKRRYGHAVENSSVVLAQYGEHQAIFITGPDHAHPFPLVIRGRNGFLQVFEYQPAMLFTTEKVGPLTPAFEIDNLYQQGFNDIIKDIYVSLKDSSPLRYNAADYAPATEIAYAVHESARTQKKITFPLEAQYAPLELLQRPPKTNLWGKKVLLYADEHYGSGGREGITEFLRDVIGQAPVTLDAATTALTTKHLQNVDILCLYHTQAEAAQETKEALEGWVTEGKPLAILHAALGAYPAWEEYKKWAGRVWKWGSSSHPYEASILKSTKTDTLGLGWKEAWVTADEVYIGLEDTSATNDSLIVEISEGQYPAAWTSAAHLNVGAWMPGHRRDAWSVPALRQGLAALLLDLLASETRL